MAFGEDLKGVLLRGDHHLEYPLHVRKRDALVEEVAHGVDEDHARPTPTQRLFQALGPQTKVEALLVVVARDARQRSANVFA